jgi:hypothetical protein
MSSNVHAFKLSDVKRAVRALQEVGLKIARVILDGGRIEFITADDSRVQAAGGETAEDVKKLL